jgi:hypothetical protein
LGKPDEHNNCLGKLFRLTYGTTHAFEKHGFEKHTSGPDYRGDTKYLIATASFSGGIG